MQQTDPKRERPIAFPVSEPSERGNAEVRQSGFRQSLFRKSLLVSLGFIILLVVFEVVVRVVENDDVQTASVGSLLRYYMPGGSTEDRNRNYSPQKPPNTFRIVVLGDSYTYAPRLPWADSYVAKLETTLNSHDKATRVEVMNSSHTGLSTVDEVQLLVRALRYFDPDLVVLQLSLNDLEPRPAADVYLNTRRFFVFRTESGVFQWWHGARLLARWLNSNLSRVEFNAFHRNLFHNTKHWRRFVTSINEMDELTQRQNVKFAVVLFPLFVSPLDDRYPFHESHAQLAELFARKGISFLDLFSSYERIDQARLQHIPWLDLNPSELGHRIAADAIHRWFRERRLVPLANGESP